LTVLPELGRRYPNARILFSGSNGALLDDGESEAKFVLRVLECLGDRGRSAPSARRAFPVEPYPVDWRTRGIENALHPFATMSEGLQRTDIAVHEWIGLAVCWLIGRSSELLAGATQEDRQSKL
jgi:hypothetical protein